MILEPCLICRQLCPTFIFSSHFLFACLHFQLHTLLLCVCFALCSSVIRLLCTQVLYLSCILADRLRRTLSTFRVLDIFFCAPKSLTRIVFVSIDVIIYTYPVVIIYIYTCLLCSSTFSYVHNPVKIFWKKFCFLIARLLDCFFLDLSVLIFFRVITNIKQTFLVFLMFLRGFLFKVFIHVKSIWFI